jgi:hypothetical protein
MILHYILLLFLCNSFLIFGQQCFVQCSDGNFLLNAQIKSMLGALNVGNSTVKDVQFPRYRLEANEYIQYFWTPTMAYMETIMLHCLLDKEKITSHRSLITVNEWLLFFHDCDYLCATKKVSSLLRDFLFEKFYSDIRSQKEHWAFVAKHFDSKENEISFNDINIYFYWLSKFKIHEEQYFLCNNEDEKGFYIFINAQLFNALQIILQENVYLESEIRIHNDKVFKQEILDLSNLELTNDILYKEYDLLYIQRRNFFKLDLNNRFLDPFLQQKAGVNFYVKKIILDKNKITKFFPCLFIKHFPNVQEISVIGCPINQYLSQDDYDMFNYKRSDYLTKILRKNQSHCDSIQGDITTIIWNGFSCLRYSGNRRAYDYENDTRPLIITVDSTVKEQAKYYYKKINLTKFYQEFNDKVKQLDGADYLDYGAQGLFSMLLKTLYFLALIQCTSVSLLIMSILKVKITFKKFFTAYGMYILSKPFFKKLFVDEDIIIKRYPFNSDKLIIKTE